MADLDQTNKLIESGFPSDEELQETKKKRSGFIQNSIVRRLQEAGFPDLAANVGAAAESASDLATPDTRKEYMDRLAVPAVGSLEKPVAGELAPTFSEAVSRGEAQAGPKSFSEFVRGRENASGGRLSSLKMPEAGSAGAVAGENIPSRTTERTLVSSRGNVNPEVAKLQDQLASIDRKTPEGRAKFKEINDRINTLRSMHYKEQ